MSSSSQVAKSTPPDKPVQPHRVAPLPLDELRWQCDPELLGFETTEELPPLATMVGQDRGVGALEFGIGLGAPGYNVYVAGPTGTGRKTTVRNRLEKAAVSCSTPPDWCYLHNFSDPYRPVAVELPSGRGVELRQDMERLVGACRREIPKAFESDEYQDRRNAIVRRTDSQREAVFNRLRLAGEQLGFMVQITPMGIAHAPVLSPGQPMSPEAFELLPDARKAEIRARSQEFDSQVPDALMEIRRLEREARDQLHALEREAALFAIGHLLNELRSEYKSHPRVVQHLDAVQADLLEHLDELKGDEQPGSAGSSPGPNPTIDRYGVNVLVSHTPGAGAPVIFEPNPTYYNLVGRVDYRAAMGAMVTDFTLIKPGALHRARGGFLVLQARDLLLNPFAWDALKRALRDQEVRVENLGEQFSPLPTSSLKPEPIKLDVKVVLIGDLLTYMLLYRLDEDFVKLFKVKAEFGPAMDRSSDSVAAYAAFISAEVRAHQLLAFHKTAVARVIDQGARLTEHRERLTTRFSPISELIVESDYWARQAGASVVLAEHVDKALAAQERRADLLEEEVQRSIEEGTIAIDTRASIVGQVNGLSVIDLGDYAFARPSRITARTAPGSDGVVNIEREVKLSGPTHDKGVMTLSGYLLGTYAQKQPLALSARLTFEQVYSGVEGDSASGAELCALLSSLADLPIRQGIAMTGSVNQWGEIQAVGGVARKIEGFFAVCQAQGLTGEQGVIIPWTNVRHLMLRSDVLSAVAEGQFHVWPVRTVDEAITLLTGRPAGERSPRGGYPRGTVHHRAQARLGAYAKRLSAARPSAIALRHRTSTR